MHPRWGQITYPILVQILALKSKYLKKEMSQKLALKKKIINYLNVLGSKYLG